MTRWARGEAEIEAVLAAGDLPHSASSTSSGCSSRLAVCRLVAQWGKGRGARSSTLS